MPVKAYIGDPRTGKTYELCSVVILQALKQGRRVVSNIAGLNHDAYVELIKAENPEIENIGTIVNLQHDEVLNPDFWITDITANNDRHERLLQRGDFLVLDEIWRFWDGFAPKDSDGKKKPEQVKNFFRMHGQMPHPKTGLICEIALITQDIQDIHRSVKNIISQTFRTTKLDALGSTKRYRLDVYNKHYVTRKPLNSYQKEYKAKYFPLYKSHSTKQEGDADAQELTTDSRGNILKGKIFVALGVLVIVAAFAIYILWGFFHPKPKESDNAQTPVTGSTVQTTPQAAPEVPAVSSSWVIKGHYQKGDGYTLVLENEKGAYRYVSAPMIVFAGLEIRASVDGQVYTNWQAPKSNQTGLMQP